MKFKHKLGVTAKDKITGFEGIIISRCEFLTGCNRYCIQPTELRDGKPLDSLYFDEDQMEVTGIGIKPKDVQGKERGACAPDAAK
jgi:hypothetical protein